ncbi:hypothetical protein JOL79_13425 [Microbispora sp. RL4-1S]|uniref:Anti-sigma-D factor RsdA sigma factor binding region domain-containing protein n=1 Tax=Microbispora oryzae TaxID=2806554 RepID=A0A941AI51_9ACTN|nr:hypothetical protein [Microbispora oryzae]MBP2704815.1 hypothetical protein [Microbispora oryzae]
MTVDRRRTAHRKGSYGDAGVDGDLRRVDAVLDALGRREPVSGGDPAVRVLAALAADVDGQWLSSVSITPST